MDRRALSLSLLLVMPAALVGCDLLGIEPASAIAARREAEGKAIGGACRHAGRALEDCYVLNKRAEKAAVFAGWREMNDYMRENQIENVTPQLQPLPLQAALGTQDDGGKEPQHNAAGAKARH